MIGLALADRSSLDENIAHATARHLSTSLGTLI